MAKITLDVTLKVDGKAIASHEFTAIGQSSSGKYATLSVAADESKVFPFGKVYINPDALKATPKPAPATPAPTKKAAKARTRKATAPKGNAVEALAGITLPQA